MKKNSWLHKHAFSAAGLALSLGISFSAAAGDRVPVVTTFSVLGDLVTQVGGEHVELTNLVDANGDAHVYNPTPSDARAVKKAKLLVMNGLGFEGWLERLTESAEFDGKLVIATEGIDVLPTGGDAHHDEHHDEHAAHDEHDEHHDEHAAHDEHHDEHAAHDEHHDEHDEHAGHNHGEWDPHAWHDPHNAIVYVRNIAAALTAVDPAHADSYQANAEQYIAQLEQLDDEIRHALKAIPHDKRKVVTPHDAFGYLAHAYEVEMIAPQGTSTDSEASAAEVAKVIRQIRQEGIQAVFLENVSDPRLVQQISRETGAKVGGKLYSDALSGSNEPASSYYGMMRHNAFAIVEALR